MSDSSCRLGRVAQSAEPAGQKREREARPYRTRQAGLERAIRLLTGGPSSVDGANRRWLLWCGALAGV